MSDFYKYFKENMEALGLAPPPETLFGTQQLAVTTISAILAYIDKYGTNVTMLEMVGAGSRLEQLATLGALGAAFYVGAAIGSLAVATGRTISGGASIADVLFEASRQGFGRQWLTTLFVEMPGIYDGRMSARKLYKHNGYIR
ncbi:hypothetical protein [Pseudoduganella chitinolytica]|uniref:DUF697 domain-containing protein n=1 Tax=Pseudoduganella chitinolytica TaxID=34070 RepID=A0ABY8B717_9BURK|nr:hypothetical protein [Pseudoduganella chitinolytica]WEF30813.1 hypothetical protein PX653_15165 [Pseudoduganella chitinolytica]